MFDIYEGSRTVLCLNGWDELNKPNDSTNVSMVSGRDGKFGWKLLGIDAFCLTSVFTIYHDLSTMLSQSQSSTNAET